MTRLTQLIQPIPAELRNGRINAWMAKRSGKVPQVSVKKHLVLHHYQESASEIKVEGSKLHVGQRRENIDQNPHLDLREGASTTV